MRYNITGGVINLTGLDPLHADPLQRLPASADVRQVGAEGAIFTVGDAVLGHGAVLVQL